MRKRRKIRLVSIIFLMLVCIWFDMQVVSRPVQAEETEGPDGKQEDTAEEETEGNETSDEKSEDQEQNGQWKEPEILYPAPDGKQGYYVTCPEIRIVHKEKRAVTYYELKDAAGGVIKGKLESERKQDEEQDPGREEEQDEVDAVLRNALKDGENVLNVWMEENPEESGDSEDDGDHEETGDSEDTGGHEESGNPEDDGGQEFPGDSEDAGNPEEEKRWEIHFLLDTRQPETVHFSYNRAGDGEVLFANEPFELFVKGSDSGSGVAAICYKMSGGGGGTITGGDGVIVLNPGFSGTVEAYAVDAAGNQSEPVRSKAFICENIPPDIQIQTGDGGDIWHRGPVQVHVTVSDPQLSSGIQSLKCYCGGEVIVQKGEGINGSGITGMETDFTVEIMSEGGNGIPIVVEVLDRAGNFRTETRMLYLDWKAPEIRPEGIHDCMITGQTIDSEIRIVDENLLAYRKMEIWKTSPEGKKERMENRTENAGETGGEPEGDWKLHLEEDGSYEIKLTAADYAGNKSEMAYHVIVDKTNPVIRYVNQMQGTYIPYFQWNYGADEFVQDFTDYTYEILLDGMRYVPGTRIREEGMKLLQVKAADAAGNQATAEAIFHIDHTPPAIHIYDVAEGKRYDRAVEMSVSVDGDGEYLKEITVNAERVNLSPDSQVFQQTFEEAGSYTLEILAEDLAGNQSEKKVSFFIEEKKMQAETIFKPVRRLAERKKDAAGQQTEEDIGNNGGGPVAAGLAVMAAGVLFAGLGRKAWKKRYGGIF